MNSDSMHYETATTTTKTIYWGEPEQAPHSGVLKMSICMLAFGPLWYGGSFCVVERYGASWSGLYHEYTYLLNQDYE